MLYRLLVYFRGVPELGPLLAGKLLGLILVGFFSILLLSNVITALSSFFLARTSTCSWRRRWTGCTLYGAKLLETAVNSSWMVVLMAVPMFTAFGVAYHGGLVVRRSLVVAVFLPFLIVPAVIGSAITLILVNVFPARRTRDILSVIAVLAAGGVVLLFRIVRPERLARPEGFRSLVEFVTVLRTPTSPFLPSEWVQRAVLGWLNRIARTSCRSICSGARRQRRSCSARCCIARSTCDRIQQGAGERASAGRAAATAPHRHTRCSRRSASCGASWC